MLPNGPFLRYDRPHHWMWLVRRFRRLLRYVGAWGVLMFFSLAMLIASGETEVQVPALLSTALLCCIGFGALYYIYLDWKCRRLHLYSDGRLEYEFGILHREGISIPMRFGAVRYVYHDRIGTWLDCADLILPYGEGAIEAVQDFRQFWAIAQGRA